MTEPEDRVKGIVTSGRLERAARRLAYIRLRSMCRKHGLSVERSPEEVEAVYNRACLPWAVASLVIRLRARGIVYW